MSLARRVSSVLMLPLAMSSTLFLVCLTSTTEETTLSTSVESALSIFGTVKNGLALAVAEKDLVADSLGTRGLGEGAERATGRIMDDSRALGNRVGSDGKGHHSGSGSEETDHDNHLEGCYLGDLIGDTDGSYLLG